MLMVQALFNVLHPEQLLVQAQASLPNDIAEEGYSCVPFMNLSEFFSTCIAHYCINEQYCILRPGQSDGIAFAGKVVYEAVALKVSEFPFTCLYWLELVSWNLWRSGKGDHCLRPRLRRDRCCTLYGCFMQCSCACDKACFMARWAWKYSTWKIGINYAVQFEDRTEFVFYLNLECFRFAVICVLECDNFLAHRQRNLSHMNYTHENSSFLSELNRNWIGPMANQIPIVFQQKTNT